MDALVLSPAIAEIFLALAVIVLVMLAAFGSNPEKTSTLMQRLSIAVLAITGMLTYAYGSVPGMAFGQLFMTSPFMVYMKLLVLIGAVVVMLVARPHLRADGIDKPEFYLLLLLSVLGMMVVISANDLMVLYMGVELQSLPLYVIAAMQRDNLRSSEAGLKYFLLGALSSGLLLYGASMIYGFAGSTGYAEIASSLADGASAGVVIGIVFLIAGLAFKISAAPFHMWTPDVYEGSPTIVTAFFAIVPKIAAMTLFMRVTYGMLEPVPESWQQVVVTIAVLSMVIGALGAIMQTDLKRLLAYSSIAHMGYALVGMASADASGISSVMVYLAIYVISSIGVFTLILSMHREGVAVHRIADLKGYSRSHPVYAAAMLIFMFSMAGIPPLGGFFGKWFVFSAAVDAGMVGLAVCGVLASVVGAFYYLRVVKVMYIDEGDTPLDAEDTMTSRLVIGLTAAGLVLFIFGLGPLRDVIAATLPHIVIILG
ncbi:MAG: NADH-quinone oxidoreductase subunit NuoN [Candidatus Puniceispirillales bacterium]